MYIHEKDSKELKEKMEKLGREIKETDPLESILKMIAELYLKIDYIEKKLAIFKLENLLLPLIKPRYAGLTSIKIDASMPLSSEQGFYALEYDAQGLPCTDKTF